MARFEETRAEDSSMVCTEYRSASAVPLAERFQVLCVTHLPQIAVYGAAHYEISKKVVEDRTVTSARMLNNKERIDEIARMMTGRKVSDRARQSARELLSDKKSVD